MNYRCLVQYDGTNYEGWQKQNHTEETIQGKLEKAVEKITGEKVNVIGAGRTDSGVHASGQRANFHLQKEKNPFVLERELNEILPDTINICEMEKTEENFHSRFDAMEKEYIYRVRTDFHKNVFDRRFVWQYGKTLDAAAMKEGAARFIGTFDFTSFCGNKRMKKSKVRTIYSLDVKEMEGELHLVFRGDGFLQGMVRIITGTLVEIGEGKKKPEEIPLIFKALNREAAGFTAPPQGLTLAFVRYKK